MYKRQLLILIPGNALIHHIADTNDVNAFLPVVPAVILILLSVILTLLGGLIPSRKAAKSDPVTARSLIHISCSDTGRAFS